MGRLFAQRDLSAAWSIKNDTTFIRGNHTFKTGMTFDRQQANGVGEQQIGGAAGFSFLQTGIPGGTTLANAGGSSFASFLLGVANTGGTETFRYIRQIYPYWSFYAQDDWRLNRQVVINYGARYEFTRPPRENTDQYTDFSPTKPNPAVNGFPGALIFAGDGPGREGTRTLIPGYYGAISPRASFAFTPTDKTTIRGGVARSFGRVTVLSGSSHYAGHAGIYQIHVAGFGNFARVLPRRGAAVLSIATVDRSELCEQPRYRLVERAGSRAPGGLRHVDALGAARDPSWPDGGGRLQRFLRIAPPGRTLEPQPGADVGGQ